MRKKLFFSAVLSLFLLVPASITWAQSVSISGVVYQNNTAKIPFTVPEGKISLYLPDDMAAGDHITGTVVMEASGKNEKEKSRNLELLKQYGVKIADWAVESRNLSFQFGDKPGTAASDFSLPDNWWGIAHNAAPISLTKMKEPVATIQMPLLQRSTAPGLFKPVSGLKSEQEIVEYEPLKKIITSSENLVLQNSKGWALDELAQLPDFSYYVNDKPVAPLCSSPRQTVIPASASGTGKNQVTAKNKDGKTVYADEFYKVEIKATIDKQNLRTKERTNMHVVVDGIQDCPYPISMTIVNSSTQTVLLDKGEHQTYSYKPFESRGKIDYRPLSVHQGVTGVVPGSFDISANLILPSYAFGDVFHQQKSALKTPEDYNAWADAVKKDLKAYAGKQGNDEVGKAAKANAQRAIDNIPKCYDKNKLDECKVFADAYLRPVNIPKGAATMWLSGFEAYKAAIKAITGTLGGKPELIDWEVIKNGLEYIRGIGEQLEDEALQNGAGDAKKLVEMIQKAGETKEKLQELQEKLKELNEGMRHKTSLDPSLLHAYKTEDLLVATFISDIPAYRTMDGTHAILNIGGQDAAGIYSLGKATNGIYEMQIAPDASPGVYDWIRSCFGSNPILPEGSITVPPKRDGSTAVVDFKNALIQEIEFPKMDTRDKSPLLLTVKFLPEGVTYSSENTKKTTDSKQSKQWMPGNFKLELGNLPCDNVIKIENFKITPKTGEYVFGKEQPAKPEVRIPGRLEYPNITFYVPETDIPEWRYWFGDYVKTDRTLDGNLRLLDQNGNTLYTLPLNKVKPGGAINANPAGDKTYSVNIKPGDISKTTSEIPGGGPSKGLDRMNDLIGVFNPFSKILFYNPQYQQQVFSKMQPVKRPDGKYDVSVLTADRKPVSAVINIMPLSPPALCNQSVQLDEKMNEVLCGGQDTKAQDKKDRTPAERIGEIWDSAGTGYLFYKNAKCERIKEAGETPCLEHILDFGGPADNIKKTGKYTKSVYSAISRCFKGTAFCTEMYFVDLLKYIYDDADCKRLIDVKKYHTWSCE